MNLKFMVKRLILFILIFLVIFSNTTIIVFGYSSNDSKTILGDIDNNGMVDINDLAILKLHLIDKKNIEEERKVFADLDKDGIISINDLAILKLILIGKNNEITVENTYFEGYDFNQITPTNSKVTFERVIMTSEDMVQFGSTGAGSQWPTSLETSKDGNLMLTGNDVAGMAKSTDHGKTWYPTNKGFESRGVGMFAIDPYDNNHILALGISKWKQNGGIYYSNNQAETWNKGFKFACRGVRYLWDGLEFDSTSYDSQKGYTTDVYFSTPYRRDTDLRTSSKEEPESYNELPENEIGLYKSIDGGKSFSIIINDKKVADGIVRITDNGDVYVGNQYGLFLIDKEKNQIKQSYLENDPTVDYTKGITGLDVAGNTIFAQTWDGIYTLTEDGTLNKITNDETYKTKNWPQFLEVSESNPDHMIYLYRENVDNFYSNQVDVSKDGGKTWQNAKFNVKSSFYKLDGKGREKVFIIDPSDDNNIITFAGYNLERSSDGGLNFTQVAGLSNTMQGGRFNFNYYNPDLMLFSAQDYTGVVTTDGGKFYNPLKIDGKGNIYGGFAADDKTYFGFANKTWWGGTLSVTHDAGKSWTDFGLEVSGVPGTPYYSCMQSYTDPNRLFAAEYYSKDKGYTWEKMNGCVSVFTINYTGKHEIYGGDNNGNLVVSYDNGDSWTRLNSQPFYTDPNLKNMKILDIAYDQVNNYAYIVLSIETSSVSNRQYVYKHDITNDVTTKITFPKDNYRGSMRIKTIALDPNSTGVVYIGGSGDYFCSATGLVRSIDGGKKWEVLTAANDSHYESIATNQGGYEITNIRVNPIDGKVWISCGCYGYETFDPPYDSSLLKHNKNIEHTIKYVYNNEIVNEEKIKNGKPLNYIYKTDGLAFLDWYTDSEFNNKFSRDDNIYNSMILYAKMEESKKLNLYINNEIYKSVDLDKFDESDEANIPIRDGYAFAGWFLDKELTKSANIDKIKEDCNLYAGWYKITDQIFNPENDDMAVYIAYSDQKIQKNTFVDNEEYVENRSICVDVDKNSKYLITFKMNNRFRIGMAKTKFWTNSKVSEYYIDDRDTNDVNFVNKYVYKVVDTKSFAKILIFYYTRTSEMNFMDIKNTFKIYKLENDNLIY